MCGNKEKKNVQKCRYILKLVELLSIIVFIVIFVKYFYFRCLVIFNFTFYLCYALNFSLIFSIYFIVIKLHYSPLLFRTIFTVPISRKQKHIHVTIYLSILSTNQFVTVLSIHVMQPSSQT